MRCIRRFLYLHDGAASCGKRTGYGMERKVLEEWLNDGQVFNRSDGCSVERRPRLKRDGAPDTASVKDARNALLSQRSRGWLETSGCV